ncbi:MAG: isocitrate/isopropylmalate family dehydrogenase, partial [Rhodospirillaceae bacterium]|nr:isocitrate/isopropylmalate family dehydrogenase [Rhodospirillaceae bacterium]
MSIREYAIAAIPADGIGIDMIEATIEVLGALQQRFHDIGLKFEEFDWGSNYYKKHGVMMPADGLKTLEPFDAILFGAVGAPDVPDHITLW